MPHEYNILEKAGSWLGHKHSDETKIIMSDAKKGENHPMFGQNHTDESKIIMSDAKKGEKNPMYNKLRPSGAGRPSQQIEVRRSRPASQALIYKKKLLLLIIQ